jgi:integrase
VERWENGLRALRPDTADRYRNELRDFLDWAKMDIGTLYRAGVESATSTDPADRLAVKTAIVNYINFILENRTSKRSKTEKRQYVRWAKSKEIYNSINKFFALNGIVIKLDRMETLSRMIRMVPTDKRKPSHEELKLILQNIGESRIRALYLFTKDTGLRISDVVTTKYGDIREGLESVDGFGGFIKRQEKTDAFALPCFGIESTTALKQWIGEWEKSKGRRIEDEDSVFINVIDLPKSQKGEQMTADNATALINLRISNIGLKGKISTHGLRYFYQSEMEKELSKNFIAKLQGRAIGDSTKHYSKHDVNECLEQYRKGYHLIAIEGASQSQQAEINKMKKEIADMKQKFEASILMSEEPKVSRIILSLFDKMSSKERVEYLQRLKNGENPPRE